MAIFDTSNVIFDDETSGDGVIFDTGIEFPNEIIARLAGEKRMEELQGGVTPPTSFPEVPVLSEQGTNVTPRPEESLLQQAGEELRYRTAPIVNPVMEVVDAMVSPIYSFGYGMAVRVPTYLATMGARNLENLAESSDVNVDMEWEGGYDIGVPDLFRNKTFVNDPETEQFLDKGGFYASLGLGITSVARASINKLGRGMVKWQRSGNKAFFKPDASGAALNPKTGQPFTGVERARTGITRSLAESSLPTEAKVALAMAVAGEVATEATGSDSALIALPAEIAGGFAAARKPATYLEAATGIIKYADTGVEVVGKKIIDAFDAKFGEDAVTLASQRIRGESVSPLEAKLALEAADDISVLSVAQQTNDSGILTLERALAAEDSIFAGFVDDQVDQAQYSLARELETLMKAEGGSLDWTALKEFLPKIQNDLVAQVDDRVMIETEKLAKLLKVYDGDVTKMSKEFEESFNKIYADIKQQENNLWQPINDSVKIPTKPLVDAVETIVANSSSQAVLPAEEFANILGKGVARTGKGWKTFEVTPDNKKKLAKEGLKVKWPDAPLQALEAPLVLRDLRSKFNSMARSANAATDPTFQYNQKALGEAQQAALDNITLGVESVNPQLREYYLAATSFSKKIHDTFTRGTFVPKAKKAVKEKKLETMVGGQAAKQTDIDIVAREMEEVFNLATSGSTAAQSNALKQAEGFLLAKFQAQVNPNKLEDFKAFETAHSSWIERFPAVGEAIKAAKKKARSQGKVVQNVETAAEAARLDDFYGVANMRPEEVMQVILKSSNPMQASARFRKLLSTNKEALAVFKEQINNRIVAQSMKILDSQVAGKGNVELIDPVSFEKILKEFKPLTAVFNTAEQKGLELLLKDVIKISKSLSAKRGYTRVEKPQTSAGVILAAKLAALKGVNLLAGSSSIVLAGTASNAATKAIQNLGVEASSKVLKEAYKNPELMKILLSKDITRNQLQLLKSGKFKTGRIIFNALTENTTQ